MRCLRIGRVMNLKFNALTLVGWGLFLRFTPQALPGGGRQGLRFVTETARGNGLFSIMYGREDRGKPLPTVVGISH